MKHRSYKLINKTELDYIDKGVNSALSKWIAMWFNDKKLAIEVDIQAMQEMGTLLTTCESKWLIGKIDGVQSIALHWSNSFPEAIYKNLVNLDSTYFTNASEETFLSKKLLSRSITSLLEIIITEFTSQTPVITASNKNCKEYLSSMSSPGAGFVLLSFSFDKSTYLVVSLDTNNIISAENNKNNDTELYPAIKSFGNSKVALKVPLGSAELDIGSVTELSVGDVIVVDKALNEKISIFINEKEICDGYIGIQDGHLSVRIDGSGMA